MAVRNVTTKRAPLAFDEDAKARRIKEKKAEFLVHEQPIGVIPMLATSTFYGDERMVIKGASFAVATEKRADDLVKAGLATRTV